MTPSQFLIMMDVLTDIRDRTVKAEVDDVPTVTPGDDVTGDKTGARIALLTLNKVLVDWIRALRESHYALDHSNELVGRECWREFTAGDIRTMINHVATELGVAQFPAPDHPEEDREWK